jgi:hypothetical protein
MVAGVGAIMAMGTSHMARERTKTPATSTRVEITSVEASHEATMRIPGLRAMQTTLQAIQRTPLSRHGLSLSSMVRILASITGWGQEMPILMPFSTVLCFPILSLPTCLITSKPTPQQLKPPSRRISPNTPCQQLLLLR